MIDAVSAQEISQKVRADLAAVERIVMHAIGLGKEEATVCIDKDSAPFIQGTLAALGYRLSYEAGELRIGWEKLRESKDD